MNILFLHRSFPAQFKYLATALACDSNNLVMFITEEEKNQIDGINKLLYKLDKLDTKGCHPYLQDFEDSVRHGEAVAQIAFMLKKEGFKPDVIYGFSSWGSTMFMKDIFPDVPLITYFEWYQNLKNSDMDFDGKISNEDDMAKVRCDNSHLLVDLLACDAGISPTNWQKAQIPKEFQDKIEVIHDGIDTELCSPDREAKFYIKDKNLELSAKDEVITYGTRGMEPYRGFPQFMEAVEKLLKKRPNAHFVIPGNDRVYYGTELENKTYKELMLEKLDIDSSRVHFVGELPLVDYLKLLQISSAHVYLTYPFVLSWSILNAMSVGCCVIASNTSPVLEVIEDNYNGLLVDFYDVDQLVEKIEYAVENKDKMQAIRTNARQTILDKYTIEECLTRQINFIFQTINKQTKTKKTAKVEIEVSK